MLFACGRCNLRSYFPHDAKTNARHQPVEENIAAALPMVSAGFTSLPNGNPPGRAFRLSTERNSSTCPRYIRLIWLPGPRSDGCLLQITHDPASTHAPGQLHGKPYGFLQDSIRLTHRWLILCVTSPPSAETFNQGSLPPAEPHWTIFSPPVQRLIPAVCGSYSGESFLGHVHFTLSSINRPHSLRLSFHLLPLSSTFKTTGGSLSGLTGCFRSKSQFRGPNQGGG